MNAYCGHGGSPEEESSLIFAHSAKEAKRIYWASEPMACDSFLDCRVHIIKKKPWLFRQADPAKLAEDEAHVVDPVSCAHCERWDPEMATDKLCVNCVE